METIRSSAEITSLFAQGRRVHTSFLTLIVLPQRDPEQQTGGRVAFIAGKKLGGAVWRNAAKRRMRAVCRDIGGPWEGLDVIFLAKAAVTSVPYDELLDACRRAAKHLKE